MKQACFRRFVCQLDDLDVCNLVVHPPTDHICVIMWGVPEMVENARAQGCQMEGGGEALRRKT